jgi:CO dehydrogenase maturation factor
VRGEPAPALLKTAEDLGLELAGSIPDDEQLASFDLEGKPTSQLQADNPVVKAAYSIYEKVIPNT